ncbi:hypothetical protein CTAYLR_009019 [Chrysophaeum taylorii]|uniref:Protein DETOXIFICATION n=1 Tax=Chrysophaeum taylorii TaxID=2483200 RepID=A0AAD7UE20_9STRA|nr:hypothetical protein CTAYLR_009019 [Chrysophaeum taylorii]
MVSIPGDADNKVGGAASKGNNHHHHHHKRRELDTAFARIAVPAFVQFSAEPIARLVDTAYLGRLGAASLGGAGAAIATTYALSKLSNDPLLRTSISFVAAAGDDQDTASTSAALALAIAVGLAQMTIVLCLAPVILTRVALVGPDSVMRGPALSYLCVAALGAPTASLWLVANGIFRGLGDTTSPLAASLLFCGLNAVLDPIFIFPLGMGAAGAAMGTAVAQTIALYPLLKRLAVKQRKPSVISLLTASSKDRVFAALGQYLSAGAFVVLRSLGKIAAYSICAREASRLGAVSAAAHNLCFQLGVATTQLCESAAVATQSLCARERKDRAATVHVFKRGLFVGLGASLLLSSVSYANRVSVVGGLTTDAAVRAAALAIFPLVMACQVLKGLAYPINGALMGFLDWKAASATMWLAQFACATTLYATRDQPPTLARLWVSLAALFSVQCVAGLARIASNTGPWQGFFLAPSSNSSAIF